MAIAGSGTPPLADDRTTAAVDDQDAIVPLVGNVEVSTVIDGDITWVDELRR